MDRLEQLQEALEKAKKFKQALGQLVDYSVEVSDVDCMMREIEQEMQEIKKWREEEGTF